MKLLIVEDDKNTLDYLKAVIDYEACGVDIVLTASDGKNGLLLYEEERPEIILSDIEMPGMTGIELLKKVCSFQRPHPEFIFLTCHDDFSYALEAIHFGVLDYLTKPFKVDDLKAVVLRAVMRVTVRQRDGSIDPNMRFLQINGSDSETEDSAAKDVSDSGKPVTDAATIRRLAREGKKMELMKIVRDELSDAAAKGVVSEPFLQTFHHSILQGIYSFLAEQEIDAGVLLKDEVYRKLDIDAERSSLGLIKLTEYLYDTAVSAAKEKVMSLGVIERVCRYIQENYRLDIGRDDIADHVGLSRNYLSKLWNLSMNKPIREYINDCRVEEAKRLLDNTDLNATEVSIEVGYDSSTYFATVFKSRTGLTPMEYRNRK